MSIELTGEQKRKQQDFRAFVGRAIKPYADNWDKEERLPRDLIGELAQRGYLGAILPAREGGKGMDWTTYGLLHEELGRGCSSVSGLLTVHDMVSLAIHKWGTEDQRTKWLPALTSGKTIAAFALTEPDIGSDAANVESTAVPSGDSYVVTGRKKWITFGQMADLFLIFAQCEGNASAFLVEKASPGLSTKPINGMLGYRASMLAELFMQNCRIPKTNLLGKEGFGLASVGVTALDLGRYAVANSCVGLGQACLEDSVEYAETREQFGVQLNRHALIQRMITDMIVKVEAARLLCRKAGYMKEAGDPDAMTDTLAAKYYASTIANQVAADAVQIHGALGCSEEFSVQRYFRDAKIKEIIEGSSQILQLLLSKSSGRFVRNSFPPGD